MLDRPQSMTGAALYWEGHGFLGSTKEVKLPDLEFISWTSNSGIGERQIDTNLLKAMTCTLTLEKYNKVYAQQLAKRHISKSFFHLKQNITHGIRQIPVVATLAGNIKKIEMPKYEMGGAHVFNFEIDVSFYKYEYDYETQWIIDLENMILQIGLVDVYADMRLNLM